RDQAIAFTVIGAARFKYRPHLGAPFFQAYGEYFEVEILFLAATMELHRQFGGLTPPASRYLQMNSSFHLTRQVAGDTNSHSASRVAFGANHLLTRLKHNGERRNHSQWPFPLGAFRMREGDHDRR